MSHAADIPDDDWEKVPEGLHRGIRLWLDDGIVPGSFIRAVICNNLMDAFAFADDESRERLSSIVSFFYWSVPSHAWGSDRTFADWRDKEQE